MKDKHWILLFVLLANLWIWRILTRSILIGLLVLLTSFYFTVVINKNEHKKFVVLMFILVFLQWRTTQIRSLTLLSNDQIRQQDQRLNEYPPIAIEIFGTKIWIPFAHWLEGRNETRIYYRIRESFFEVIDPNLYFFANNPRQRVGITEFEKFPYILLPFFVSGVYKLVYTKKYKLLFVSMFLPVITISVIGHNNNFGPFSLFPFISMAIFIEVLSFYDKYVKNTKIFRWTVISMFVLVMIQLYSYEIY